MAGWLGPISGWVSDVRDFIQGALSRGAEEGFSWPEMTDALAWGGLERFPEELHKDFEQHVLQTVTTDEIARLRSDYLIPESLHVETERLLPHKYAYNVDVRVEKDDGSVEERTFYVGSDKRLSTEEIMEISDEEAGDYREEGDIGFTSVGISASWRRSG